MCHRIRASKQTVGKKKETDKILPVRCRFQVGQLLHDKYHQRPVRHEGCGVQCSSSDIEGAEWGRLSDCPCPTEQRGQLASGDAMHHSRDRSSSTMYHRAVLNYVGVLGDPKVSPGPPGRTCPPTM